ncbi:MAG TPA: CPBP family glutamic-type intramembrane protease [Cyclobacteriaceae bacterium]|nr:CPBP family glutamic-type intramembrane protease [Cyclobacteriaceae bacterium]
MEDLKTLKTSIGLQLQRFLDKPDIKREERELPFRSFMHLLLLDLAFAGLLTAFLHLLGIDKSAYHRFDMELFKKLPILFFIGGVIVAPFFEEYLFRYFLDYRTKTLTISTIMLFLVFVMAFDRSSPFDNAIYFFSFSFVLTMLLLKQLYNFRSPKMLVWGSIICFGLFHITNYHSDAYAHNILLIPFLVAPQLIGGFFLAFIRTQYRFIHCVMFHAAFNAVIFIFTLATL